MSVPPVQRHIRAAQLFEFFNIIKVFATSLNSYKPSGAFSCVRIKMERPDHSISLDARHRLVVTNYPLIPQRIVIKYRFDFNNI
jgi:hypothetical protein